MHTSEVWLSSRGLYICRVLGGIVFAVLSAAFVHLLAALFFGLVTTVSFVALLRRPRIEVNAGQLTLVRSRSSTIRVPADSVAKVERVESVSGAALNGMVPNYLAVPDIVRFSLVNGGTADYYDGLEGSDLSESSRLIWAALTRQ